MLDKFFNRTPTFYKWDKFLLGLLPGLLFPLLAFGFFYLLQMKTMSVEHYLRSIRDPFLLSKILSFGCIINLAVFFLFISRDYYNAARGVIAATILYAIPTIIAKFIL